MNQLIPTWMKIRDSIKEVPEMLDRVGEATEGVPEMLKRVGKEGAQSWGDGFKEIAKNFGSLMTDAIVNGNWQNAFTALGSQVGSFLGTKIGASLAKNIGGLLGETVGAILPGIGALLGPLLDKVFGKLLKTEGKKVNDLRDAFINAAGGIEALNRKAVAAGMTLDALLKAKTVKDYEKAVAALNEELARTAELQGELAGLQAQLASRQVMDWQKAQELIEKYGGTLGNLGQQFTDAKAAADWKSIWDDWQTLIDMGADVGGVLVSMKDEIEKLVQTSLRIGTEIPAQFKPLIEELIRTGQLFDENGKAITDIAQLKFGAPLVSEVDKIIAKIDELISALTDHLIPALGSIPDKVNIKVGYEVDDFPDIPGRDRGGEGYASGTHGQFLDFGAGTLVTLHGRERVMTPGESGGGGVASPSISPSSRRSMGGKWRGIRFATCRVS